MRNLLFVTHRDVLEDQAFAHILHGKTSSATNESKVTTILAAAKRLGENSAAFADVAASYFVFSIRSRPFRDYNAIIGARLMEDFILKNGRGFRRPPTSEMRVVEQAIKNRDVTIAQVGRWLADYIDGAG